MNKTEKDKEFYELANDFIELANRHGQNLDKGKISAAFLYAAARFNTFVVASSAENTQQMESFKERALEYFVNEYKKMLEEHFTDYAENFSQYITPSPQKNHIN
jgi:hypothetical protein